MTNNKLSILFFAILGLLAMQFTACESNKCKTRGTVCNNGGTCNDGICICPSGYEGDSCQYPMNLKFVGDFGGILLKPNHPTDDTIYVKQVSGNTNLITWTHKYIPNVTFVGNVVNNEILVPSLLGANGITYSGSGSMNTDIFTLTMKADSIYQGITLSSYNYTFSGARKK